MSGPHPSRPAVALARAGLAVALGLVTACQSTSPSPPPLTPPARSAGAAEVERALGQVSPAAVAPSALRARVAELAAEQRLATASVRVLRHPEVALDALREAAATTPGPGDRVLARLYAAHTGEHGWPAALEAPRTGYGPARERLLAQLRSGEFTAALAEPIPPSLPAPLSADLAQLRALAAMAGPDPAAAAEALAVALRQASDQPFVRVELLALRSAAQRRRGEAEAATASWREAVDQAAALLRRGVADPRGWERLAYLQPKGEPWPPALAHALGEPVDATLFAAIGRWRLERDEPGAALLALKRAETAMGDRPATRALRRDQARALARMGQRGLALSILGELATVGGTEGAAALAALGSIELQRGQVDRARALLRRAVEEGGEQPWPGRARAEGDLGLALLIAGDEAEGLRHLRRAADRFAQSGELEQELLARRNELAFHEEAGHAEEATSARAALAALEAR